MNSIETAVGWHVYILRCVDGTLYTGITSDMARRLKEHNGSSRGAGYTRGRRPVELAFVMPSPDRASASRLEWRIKQLARSNKERLISGELRLELPDKAEH